MTADVLLIDDDKPFVESVQALFEASGIPLDVARSWDEGVAEFRVGLHELVVADYNLPGSKLGLKLLLALRRLRPRSRLLLISGAVNPNASQLIAASGLIDRFIPKTADLAGHLLEEARASVARATERTDWHLVGQAYLQERAIDEDVLNAIDDALRTQMTGR